jgi:RecA/RadA recombinase
VEGLLPKTGVTQLVGPTGCGKSAVALHLAANIIEGRPFLGHAIHRKGVVLWLAAEGEEELDPRSLALQHEGLFQIPAALGISNTVPRLTDATAEAQLRDLVEHARLDLAESGNGDELVAIVVDTLAAAANWTDENSSAEAQSVFSMLRRVAQAHGLAMIVIDHVGKGGEERGTRGSSAKDAAADVRISLQMSASGHGTLKLTKSRARPKGDLGEYQIKAVVIGQTPAGGTITAAYADIQLSGVASASLSKGGQDIAAIATELVKSGTPVSKSAVRKAWMDKGNNSHSFGKAYKDAERAGLVPAGDLRKGDIIDLTLPADPSACEPPSNE